jgi:hypothetical protein
MVAHPDFRPGAPQPVNLDEQRPVPDVPVQQQKSQLQLLAEQKLSHQASLRAAVDASTLPPARPPVRPQAVDDDPPF